MVATTRPETMLGDTAVAVHPDDPRYTRLVGKTVELPLTGRRIPVIADDHVDPAFGTGAVKVTPAHDPNDFEIGRRHDLPSLTIMDEHGVITAHGPFQGLDRFEARPAVVRALREQGRIVSEVRPYVHAVGHCSRCGSTVEPRQSLQWFVRVAPLAKAAGDAVRDGRVRLHPAEMNARYFSWVDDMHDWTISRQLWWGHRIPVFYGPNGQVCSVGPGEQAPEGWTQDPDVLDTWFSSALWPFSTLGWPDDTPDLRTFYPTSVLVTGYDILFFWVARMMMFGLYAMRDKAPADAIPFRVVVLHGLVRDQFGKKISKSRGNTIDPLDWMDRFGADATRFTLARGANPGSDIAISEEWAAGSATSATSSGTPSASPSSTAPTSPPPHLHPPPRDPRPCPRHPCGPYRQIRHFILCPGSVDPLPPVGRHRRGGRAVRAVRVRQDLRRAVPLRLGRGSATGTWSWPRCRSTPATKRPPRRPGRCWASCSTSCCGCSIRSYRS